LSGCVASRADFIHKLAIANKELMEAREATELIAILTASIKTARSRDAAQPHDQAGARAQK
jgi:hypothetical protein